METPVEEKKEIPSLTREETIEAIERYQKEKAERTKGTSVEHSDTLMQLSPEMRAALSTSVAEAVKGVYEQEVERRQHVFGEGFGEARHFVGNAVEQGFIAAQRKKEEDRLIADFVSGVYCRKMGKLQKTTGRKGEDVIREVYEKEAQLLNRDTIHTRDGNFEATLESRAMGGATAGDELVPEVFSNRVIDNIERRGLVRTRATVIPMSTDTLKVPKITSGLTAYEVTAGSQITASDLVTAQLTLNTRKLATITAFYNELLLNADPAIVPIITEQAAIALAAKEDDLAFTGSGSTVEGILESSTNNVDAGGADDSGSTAISDIDFDDFARLIDALGSQYIDEGVAHYFNKKVLLYLSMLATANGYLFAPPTASTPGTIRGFNYFTSSGMPSAPSADTAYAFTGNLKHLYMGDRQKMTVAIGTEGTVGADNLFEKDMSAIRVIEHVEFEIADASGFSILTTSST